MTVSIPCYSPWTMSNPFEAADADIGESSIAGALITRNVAVFDPDTVDALLEVLRTKNPEILLGGIPVSSISWLGSGGAKTVHDVKILGKHYALSIPNAIQGTPAVMEKWPIVLDEAANTERLRTMGFFTNSLCRLVQSTINGVPFPVLLMRRYRDLPFEVRDNKNPISSVGCRRILPPGISTATIIAIITSLADDIRNLLMHNVHVHGDSLNICIADGQPRLYFNDLGTATFTQIPKEEHAALTHFYAEAAVSAVINGVIEEEYDEYHAYFDDHHQDLSDALYALATAMPMSQANPTNSAAR